MRLRSSRTTTTTTTSIQSTVMNAVQPSNGMDHHAADGNIIELLNIGPLVEGKLIQRPAKPTTSSPYIAEVQLTSSGERVLAWAPALDVGGLCVAGSTVWLSETSKTNPDGSPKKKQTMSTHAIELVQADEPECGDDGTVLIGANPNLGEKLAYEVLMRGLLEDEIRFGAALDEKLLGVHDDENKKSNRPKKKRKSTSKGDNTNNSATTMDTAEKSNHNQVLLKRQQTYNDSRIDVELRQNDKRCLIEIKNVVCADYCKDTAPSKKGKNHCVVVSDASASLDEDAEYSYQRSGLFPWGKKTQQFEDQKVVSARAIKHVRNLVDLHLTSAAKEQEVESSSSNSNLKNNDGTLVTSCMVLFVLNRADCLSMRACHEGCGVFATELKKAADAGVLVRSFRVKWTTEGLAYFDGIVPVDFSKTIT